MIRAAHRRTPESGADSTRQRLVDATVGMIVKQGLDAVEIDAVLAKVGVTKGSMYHHFASVNDLLVEALVDMYGTRVDETLRMFESMLDGCTSAEEVRIRLHEVNRLVHRREEASVRFLRTRVLSLVPSNGVLAARLAVEQRRLTEGIVATVRGAQERGWFRPELDPHAMGVFVQSYTLGRIVDDVVEEHMSDEGWIALVDHVVDSFFVD